MKLKAIHGESNKTVFELEKEYLKLKHEIELVKIKSGSTRQPSNDADFINPKIEESR